MFELATASNPSGGTPEGHALFQIKGGVAVRALASSQRRGSMSYAAIEGFFTGPGGW